MRLKKKPTVVEGIQATETGDYGTLGTMNSGDYFISTASGDLMTLTEEYVTANYVQVSDGTPLQGSDVD